MWLFGLPLYFKKYWVTAFGSFSNGQAEFIINLVPIPFFIGYNLIMLPIYYIQHPFFEQFKIQNDTSWQWLDHREKKRRSFWALVVRSIKMISVNLFILLPILSFLKIYTLERLGLDSPSAFAVDSDHWPSMIQNCRDIFLLSLVHELGFYTTHRMMHTYPSLYKYHKVHHEFKANIALASLHNHPVDFILSIGVPALLAISIINPHSSTQLLWSLWTLQANLDDHVGYSFPWSPVRWFPFAATTDEHEFHHSKNLGCFGSKLSIFNSIFGGYEHYYAHTDKYKKG